MAGLTHFDRDGNAHMVDVSEKAETDRIATARGHIRMLPETLQIIQEGSAKKGDVIGIARLAGNMAAKRTADLDAQGWRWRPSPPPPPPASRSMTW